MPSKVFCLWRVRKKKEEKLLGKRELLGVRG